MIIHPTDLGPVVDDRESQPMMHIEDTNLVYQEIQAQGVRDYYRACLKDLQEGRVFTTNCEK